MAYAITDRCISCWACLTVCPNQAIAHVEGLFMIDPQHCTECAGDFPDPQCSSICPVEGAIENEWGEPVNPPGSLSSMSAR
ncbi:MAG: ferredoxin [Proteobacteria bacterium]|nr:ferredoxin [Pseudomonadota bacterium]